MKIINNLFLMTALAGSIISCSNNSEQPVDGTTTPDTSLALPFTEPTPATPAEVPPAGEPGVQSTASGMNPAHGQPGHRCDIPEGTPLSTPPGNNNPAGVQIETQNPGNPQPVSIPVQQPQTPALTPTAAGMNPAHGQPGHDCSIPVGAPLKK